MHPTPPAPRIAIVVDWLQDYAGAERVLEQLLLTFPQAEVFAVVVAVDAEVIRRELEEGPRRRALLPDDLALTAPLMQAVTESGYEVLTALLRADPTRDSGLIGFKRVYL